MWYYFTVVFNPEGYNCKMQTDIIDSRIYAEMLLSAANSIENSRDRINALNVFPVPDGDTGSNMSMTMSALRTDGAALAGPVSESAKKAASMMLGSARGNSGVILSLFFKGFAKGFAGREYITVDDIPSAVSSGVDEAYKAIQNPTEGTILTVMRSTAGVRADTLTELFETMLEYAEEALAKTPEQLPILKQANVVDAGGAGFVEILKGMTSALHGNIIQLERTETSKKADFASFDEEDITFTYCTECIINKSAEYAGEGNAPSFRDFVMSVGDSAVFLDDDELIKVHVHTNDPGAVMSEAIKYGELRTVKVENMRLQHSHLIEDEAPEINSGKKTVPSQKYGFVAVTMGDGIRDTFSGLGADSFVYGGQTMNPSTAQILDAVDKSVGETVFILPNNSNICLVARQAAGLVEGRRAIVIPSTSVPQGLAAMLAFSEDASEEENESAMTSALANVETLELTYAANDAAFDGKEIKKDQILGLVEHKVKFVSDSLSEAMDNFSENLKDASYVTVFYGADVTEEEAEKMHEQIQTLAGEDVDISMLSGGQPLYYYVISVEK